MENFNLSGYAYIDEEITKISSKLTEEEKQKLFKTCTNLYSAGVSEGIRKIKTHKTQK